MDKNKQISKRRTSVKKTSPKRNSKTQYGSGLFDKKKIAKAKEETETKLSRSFNYDLRFYQTFPAFYLKNIAPEQKGLLVNHLMGTGKTFTGINFLTDYPDKKALIVCSSYLKNIWINELNKLGIKNLNLIFITYDEFIDIVLKINENLDKYILVIDEGHNLINIIRTKIDAEKIQDFYEKVKNFYKILFLSGTPFYTDEYDIIYIINLVSGETLLPFNTKIFEDEYFIISKINSVLYGYLNPILESKATLLAIFGSFIIMYVKGIMDFTDINEKDSNIIDKINKNVDIGNDIEDIKLHPGDYKETSDMIYAIKSKELAITNNRNDIAAIKLEIDSLLNKPGYQFIKKYLSWFGLSDGLNRRNTNKDYLNNAPLIFIGIMAVFIAIVYLISRFNLNNIKTIDNKKLGLKISKYVSFYEVKNTEGIIKKLQVKKCHSDFDNNSYFLTNFCKTYLENLQNSDYPSKELIIQKNNFNSPQMFLFLKACYNRLTPDDILTFGIKNTDKESKYYDNLNENDFLNYGRVISNLTLKNDKNEILIPAKFIKILKISENKQTVIYSNFYDKGLLLFAKYLEDNNKKFKIINDNISPNELSEIINKFKNKVIQYILLHPNLVEGISIFGAEQLHILEPLNNYAKFDQLQYRVVRYNSHTHLPLKERKVQIYQWITKSMPIISNIIHKFKGWSAFSAQVILWKRLTKFDDNFAPDEIVYEKNIRTSELFEKFTHVIKDYSIESCSVKNKNFNCDLPYSIREMFKE